MTWVATGVAVGGAALGGAAGYFGSRKGKRDPYGTLNPEQKQVTQGLGSAFQQQLNRGPQQYSGQFIENISPEETANIANYSRLNTLRGDSLGSIFSSSPEALNSEFDTQVANPTLDYYKRNIQPLTEENLSGFSTDRGRIVGSQLTDLAGNLAQQRFDAQQRRRDQIINASGALNQAGTTSAGIYAIPREIKQAGLDRAYADYLQANEQHANSINQMLQFLGISTVTERPNTTSAILQGILAGGKTGMQIMQAGKQPTDQTTSNIT